MNIRNKTFSRCGLLSMICAVVIFSLSTATPLKAQESGKEFKPVGASPGTATPVKPPKNAGQDATDSTKSPDQAKPKTTGVGAAAGGAGSSSAKTVGGISLKKALIIGASIAGVAALLIAGSGGGDGGTSSDH